MKNSKAPGAAGRFCNFRNGMLSVMLVWITGAAMAQHPLKLNFVFRNNSQDIILNQSMPDLSGKAYKASEIAMYISNLKITHDGGQLLDFGDSVFYINIRASLADLGVQPVNEVEAISFSTGVPEHLNHTDISAYPEDHPLYFKVPAMHWGWAAGYTFFMIDGMADSNNDQVPDASFELHCLGDANLQNVQLANKTTVWEDGTREIFQYVNIDQWLRNIDLSILDIQHGSTGPNASAMSNVVQYPVFTAPVTASLEQASAGSGAMGFSSAGGVLEISWESMNGLSRLEIFDVSGKMVQKNIAAGLHGKKSFYGIPAGTYIVRAVSEGGSLLGSIKAVQP